MTSRVLYLGDGQAARFAIPFPYLSPTHVHVFVNKIERLNPLDWGFDGDGFVVLKHTPAQKDAVEIIRFTESEIPLSQFQDGSILTEAELNLATLQNLYLNQELRDYMDALLNPAVNNIASNLGVIPATAGEVIDAVVQGVLDSELLADLQQHITDIDTNAATIGQQAIRSQAIEDAISNINGIAEPIATLVQNESDARVAEDTAIVNVLDLIGAKSGDSLAFVLNQDTLQVSPGISFAQHLSDVQTQTGDAINAAVTVETTARTDADSALATSVSNVAADVEANHALIVSNATASVDADSALTTRIDGIEATTGNNTALILAEQTARAEGDSAVASSVATLQTSVDGNTAGIQTLQTVTNGVTAEYTIKLDVNGYVSGVGLINDGAKSQFIITADQFAVVTPGKTPVVPFAVDANGVYMNNAYIRNLAVDKITGGAIKSFWNLSDATGRIVLDTGTYMKVMGAGFGLNHDLIEWFGPKMDVGSCTRANAITFVATNGDAYFGGSLSAGTLYNAVHGTSVQINVDVIDGPFGSNGGSINVVCSYSYHMREIISTLQGSFAAGSGPTNATVNLYRTIGTGVETLVASQTFTGDLTINNGQGDTNSEAIWNISGSITYTDAAMSTNARTYRARVTSRNQQSVTPSGSVVVTDQSQSLSIIATEQ